MDEYECDESPSGNHMFEDGECIFCGLTDDGRDSDDSDDDDDDDDEDEYD